MSNDIFLLELTPTGKGGENENGSGFPIKCTLHETVWCQRKAATQTLTLHIDHVRTIYHGR